MCITDKYLTRKYEILSERRDMLIKALCNNVVESICSQDVYFEMDNKSYIVAMFVVTFRRGVSFRIVMKTQGKS